jgi:hypothetical protein
MKNIIAAAAVLAATVAFVRPAFAEAPAVETAAPATYQVIRLGDNQMSCEALITEINGINAEMQTAQADMSQRTSQATRNAMRAARGPGMGATAAMSLGSLAASFIPGGALVAQAASMAASTAQQAQMQAQQDQSMDDMEALTEAMTTQAGAMGPMSQRASHLMEIARVKAC